MQHDALPSRVVHVALADARGHLMRAHLLRTLLQTRGVRVDIVTTQEAGAAFLASLGTPSTVLPGRFRMEVDAHHQLLLGRTRRRFIGYAMADLRRDVDALRELTAGAAFIVNDSFHPALLAAHRTLPHARVVHLHGDNLKATVAATSRPFRVERWLGRAFAEIVHTLDPVESLSCTRVPRRRVREGQAMDRAVFRLPPLVAAPVRSRAEVRASLALTDGGSARGLAAVYLNPHYADPAIARVIEEACAARGLALYGVSEVFADRPQWRAADPAFLDVVAAADVFLSGAGMGALEQSRVTGTPLVCLLGKQEEQTRNVRDRRLAHVHIGDVSGDAVNQLVGALAALPVKTCALDAATEVARVHALWTETFDTLLKEATHDAHGHQEHDRARHRDQQPARGPRERRRFARSLAVASA